MKYYDGELLNDRSNFFDAVFHTPRYKRYWDETKERAYEVLALVHLQDKANEYVGSLPYGVQKGWNCAARLSQTRNC